MTNKVKWFCSFRKATRSATNSALTKELEQERQRNASLLAKLKRVKSDHRKFEQSVNEGSFVRLHSTMRDDSSGNDHNSVFMSSMSNLSLASLNVPECRSADGEDEIDRKSFEQWKNMLEASMQLAGVADEVTKMNIFTIKAGPKLLDVLEGTVTHPETPDIVTNPYANAIQRLNAYFGSRDYIFMQRQKLRSLTQNAGEKDVKYVKRVIAIAKLCDFSDNNLPEQVADSIQSHALNQKVREAARKMLRKGGSLADLLDRVRTLEMDQLNEDIFVKNNSQAAQLTVAAVTSAGQRNQLGRQGSFGNPRNQSNTQHYQYGSNNGFGTRNGQRSFSGNWLSGRGGRGIGRRDIVRNTTSRVPCWRCMSRRHQPSECFAVDQACRNCNVRGHFERACRQQKPSVSSSESMKRRYSNDSKESSSKKIAAVKEEDDIPVNETVSGPSSE